MALKTVDTLAAFSPGCDLWIVGPAARSKWARKIDWHLNFQMRRADLHQSRELSPELLRVVADCETLVPSVPSVEERPLMIASSALLPNVQTVLISSLDWILECHRVWTSLGRPLARVFLPDDLSAEAFSRAWPAADRDVSAVEVVVYSPESSGLA